MEKIKLGISTCLLGENVRYDGGHKLDRFLSDTMGQYVKYVPVCPEVECGLGVPRESMHLEGDPDSPCLVTTYSKQDMTERMIRWARKRITELEKEDLCGFIFKSNSPSSGMERIKVYNEKGMRAEAMADFNKAMELNAKSSDAYLNRGLTYAREGKFQDPQRAARAPVLGSFIALSSAGPTFFSCRA